MVNKESDPLRVDSDSMVCGNDEPLGVDLSTLRRPGDMPHIVHHHSVW